MFNNESVKVVDRIWISEEEKWKACIDEFHKNDNTIFICWFEETYEKLKTVFSINALNSDTIYLSRQADWHSAKNENVIFIEHYPLQKKEEELFIKLGLKNVIIFSSLDEPLFKQFGGDKIISLLQKTGHKKEESIDHSLISSSIKTAQEKIAAKVVVEISANSQSDWFIKNLLA